MPAAALETFEFVVEETENGLENRLRGVSLLVETESMGTDNAQELLAAARADYTRLVGALYDAGHFGAVVNITVDGVEAATIQPLDAPEQIDRIRVVVQPGSQYSFSTADVDPLASGTELPDRFAVGEPASTGAVRQAASAAITGWRNQGRAVAEVAAQDIVARHADDRLSARITIAPGPVVTFGELILTGESAVPESRIRQIAGFPTGERFSEDDLRRVATRLRRTGTFRSVNLREAETLSFGDRLDVTANVVDAEPRRISLGAEVATEEGVTLSASWLHRNFLGGAERFRIDGEVAGISGDTGGINYTLNTRFERPAVLGPDTDFIAEGSYESQDEPAFDSQTVEISAGLRRIFSDRLTAEASLGVRYTEDTDAFGTQEYFFLTAPSAATYDRRNDDLDPTDGYWINVEATPFLGINGSDNGLRIVSDSRGYQGYGEDDRFVLAARAQIASVPGGTIDGVPNDWRFFSGGGGTVRGQDYQTLGVIRDGELTGGLSRGVLSGELRVGVTDNIETVAFYDYGHVGRSATPFTDGNDHAGTGIGLRYLTGIGPIRVDLATPATGEDQFSQLFFYIGIGQAF